MSVALSKAGCWMKFYMYMVPLKSIKLIFNAKKVMSVHIVMSESEFPGLEEANM